MDEGLEAMRTTALFLDIGGVLLTNGWDRLARKRAAQSFKLAWAEMEDRHHLTIDTYEAESSHLTNTWAGWSFTKSGRSPVLSFGASCARNRNLTPR